MTVAPNYVISCASVSLIQLAAQPLCGNHLLLLLLHSWSQLYCSTQEAWMLNSSEHSTIIFKFIEDIAEMTLSSWSKVIICSHKYVLWLWNVNSERLRGPKASLTANHVELINIYKHWSLCWSSMNPRAFKSWVNNIHSFQNPNNQLLSSIRTSWFA